VKVYHFGEGPAIGQYAMLISDLLDADPVHTGEWQAMKTGSSPMHATHELEDVSLVWDRMPGDFADIMPFVDQPWATEHFAERVSGIPYNPAPSAVRWPYAVRNNADHTTDSGTYDHTYPERFWPQHAGDTITQTSEIGGLTGARHWRTISVVAMRASAFTMVTWRMWCLC
jgi:hypothetical protein